MIELFTPKQIRCEHCGFEFVMTGFGSAAKIVCLACGKETTFTPPAGTGERKPAFPEIVSKSATEALLCSVEQCPLLTEGETGSEIAEQVKLRLRKRAERRRNILSWTVTLQVCVLLGVALFVAKPLLLPEESPIENPVVKVETETEPDKVQASAVPTPPVQISRLPGPIEPLPALLESRTARSNAPASDPPFPLTSVPEYAVSPFEMSPAASAHHNFLPPVIEPVIAPSERTIPGSLVADEAVPDVFSVAVPPSPEEPMTIGTADQLLESAKVTLATDPENSVQKAARAAKIYEELEQPFPDSLYWIMGNAFASLSWGEPLLESSPAIESMTLSADNRYLLAQLKDKTVWLWDLQSPEEDRTGYLLDKGTAEYVKFVFSPDLRWIIGGQKNGIVRIWDMSLRNPGETLITFVEIAPGLQDLQVSPNGQWLAAFGNAPRPDHVGTTATPPLTVALWNLRQMEAGVVPMATLIPSMLQPAQIIRFSPNSDRLAIGSKDAVVRVYDLTSSGIGEEPFVLRGHQLGISQIVFSPSGEWVATGSHDNTVRLWNLTSQKAAPESVALFGHIGWISTLTIDRSGEYIFSGSYDRTIRIWNVKQSRIITALHTPPIVLETNLGIPESLAITQDGDKMVVQGSEGSLGIYHLPSLLGDSPEEFYKAVTFRNSMLSISRSLLTTDDRLLIFSYEHLSNPSNNGIRLWALQTQPFVR